MNPDGNDDNACDSDDDYADRDGQASDEDDEIHVRQKFMLVDPEEEADFDREFRSLMQESSDSRKLELRSRPMQNVMIPMNVFEGSTRDHHGRASEGESGDEAIDNESGGRKEVQVKVLVKQQMKQKLIPRHCSLVQSTKQKEAAELEEKQDIKRLVLEYNDREEEELNVLGNLPVGWNQTGGGRVIYRGDSWEGRGVRSGSHHRHPHHTGGGYYFSRRR